MFSGTQFGYAGTHMLISRRKYAESKGVSEGAVRKAIAAGKIPVVDGMIDPEIADAAWERNRDAQQPSKMAAPVQQDLPAQQEIPLGPEPKAGSLAAMQARHTEAKAVLTEMKVREMEGQLGDVAEMERAFADLVLASQNLLLTVGNKVKRQLAASRDEMECGAIVDREIREALKILSRYRPAEIAA